MILSNLFSVSSSNFSTDTPSIPFWGGGSQSLSGISVTPESSLQLSQYYACIRNIAEDTAKLPIGIYQVNTTTKHETIVIDDNITRLLNVVPNPDMSPMTCREVIQSHACGWGNGYAEIVKNQTTGKVTQIIPIHPSRVTIERDQKTNRLVYKIFDVDTLFNTRARNIIDLDQEDVFHIKGLGGDGIYGFSMAHIGKNSIGVGIATQNYGATFFGNNTQLGMVLKHPGKLSKEAQERLLESVEKNRKGSSNSFKSMVLEEGMDVESSAIAPGDAQFIEARQFQVEDIARWFRMPLSKLQTGEGKKSVKNYEEENIAYHTDTLLPWMIRWEQEIKIKLLGVTTKKRAKFNTRELLRGDSKAQVDYAKGMSMIGSLTIDEVRTDAGLNPVGGEIGKTLFMQGAMTTVDRIIEGDAKTSEPKAKDLSQKNQNPAKEQGDNTAEAFGPMVDIALATIWNKESKARERAFSKLGKDGFDFNTWADEFYTSLQCESFSKIEPIFSSFARVIDAPKQNQKMALVMLNETLSTEFAVAKLHIDKGYKGIRSGVIINILNMMEGK